MAKRIEGNFYHAGKAAEDLTEIATKSGEDVVHDFNGTDIVAHPGDDPVKVFKRWVTDFDADHLKRLNSPEGRRRRRENLEEVIANAQEEIDKINRGEQLS